MLIFRYFCQCYCIRHISVFMVSWLDTHRSHTDPCKKTDNSKEQLPPSSYASVIEWQSSVCLICSNLPMITVSLGDIQLHSRWQSFKNVGLALDSYIKDEETELISIQVLLAALSVQLQKDHSGSLPYSILQTKIIVKHNKILKMAVSVG